MRCDNQGKGDALLCPCEKDMMRLESPAGTKRRSALRCSTAAARPKRVQLHNQWTGQVIGSVVWNELRYGLKGRAQRAVALPSSAAFPTVARSAATPPLGLAKGTLRGGIRKSATTALSDIKSFDMTMRKCADKCKRYDSGVHVMWCAQVPDTTDAPCNVAQSPGALNIKVRSLLRSRYCYICACCGEPCQPTLVNNPAGHIASMRVRTKSFTPPVNLCLCCGARRLPTCPTRPAMRRSRPGHCILR